MRLIDADALKQLVDEEWFNCREKSAFFDEIDRTTTIDSKKGKWIFRNFENPYIWGCSECGDHVRARYNFCPNCGARMERSEE